MPTIDATQGVLVIRIVYDGPAMSGKTSSLKSLAGSVQSRLESREERDGRTLYFDWMEYVGGLFEGRQIRCQIVSVPGQVELAARRKRLLAEADAVVCVLDTRHGELDYGLSWLAELVPHCRGEQPPVGVVLQANKRDAKDAVPRDELRTRVSQIGPIAIVESVATAADGIREAFVLAVRLALDRVRALSNAGLLSHEGPTTKDAEALFASLQDAEAEVAVARRASEHPTDVPPAGEHDAEQPFVPDPMMPGGTIWPPVDGRALLHEVAQLGLAPMRTSRGDWWGSVPGWRIHSSQQAIYADADRGREALIAWARMHAAQAAMLSAGRAVVLADAGGGRSRLWQLLSVVPTLRELLDSALEAQDASDVAAGIVEVADALAQAREGVARSGLACTLWSVGYLKDQVRYAGLMPMPHEPTHDEVALPELLARELTPHLRRLRRSRVDYTRVVRELFARAELSAPHSVPRQLVELTRAID